MKIRQILFNLLTNACKHSEDSTIDFRIQQEEIDQFLYLSFTVEDKGKGIPKDKLEAIELAFGTKRVNAAVIPRGRGARAHAAHGGFVVELSSVLMPPQAASVSEIVASDHFTLGPLLKREEASARDGH